MGQGGEQGEAGYRMMKSPVSTGNQTTELVSHCRTHTFVLGGREGPLSRLRDEWAGWAACLIRMALRMPRLSKCNTAATLL